MSDWRSWPLGRAIALAVVVKFFLLWLLWLMFFATPPTKKMRLPTPTVEQHLLGSASPTPSNDKVKAHDSH